MAFLIEYTDEVFDWGDEYGQAMAYCLLCLHNVPHSQILQQ